MTRRLWDSCSLTLPSTGGGHLIAVTGYWFGVLLVGRMVLAGFGVGDNVVFYWFREKEDVGQRGFFDLMAWVDKGNCIGRHNVGVLFTYLSPAG